MTRVMVIGAGSHSLGRAIANALSDLAVKATVACLPSEPCMAYMTYSEDYQRTEHYKKSMRDQARYNEAGVQQRRKALAKFHKEKRARMAHKQATKRRNRFV